MEYTYTSGLFYCHVHTINLTYQLLINGPINKSMSIYNNFTMRQFFTKLFFPLFWYLSHCKGLKLLFLQMPAVIFKVSLRTWCAPKKLKNLSEDELLTPWKAKSTVTSVMQGPIPSMDKCCKSTYLCATCIKDVIILIS